MDPLNLKELGFIHQTQRHIDEVRKLLNFVSSELFSRGVDHDRTKLERPEVLIDLALSPQLAENLQKIDAYREFYQSQQWRQLKAPPRRCGRRRC